MTPSIKGALRSAARTIMFNVLIPIAIILLTENAGLESETAIAVGSTIGLLLRSVLPNIFGTRAEAV